MLSSLMRYHVDGNRTHDNHDLSTIVAAYVAFKNNILPNKTDYDNVIDVC